MPKTIFTAIFALFLILAGIGCYIGGQHKSGTELIVIGAIILIMLALVGGWKEASNG